MRTPEWTTGGTKRPDEKHDDVSLSRRIVASSCHVTMPVPSTTGVSDFSPHSEDTGRKLRA